MYSFPHSLPFSSFFSLSNSLFLFFIESIITPLPPRGTIEKQTYEIVATLEGHHKRRVLGATKIGDFVWTYSWDGGIHLYHHSVCFSLLFFSITPFFY